MPRLKKKPIARLKIGDTFLGQKISATAEGYVIYGEYDAEDKQTYYWEEWELRGFNNYDSWIEYDHYTREVTLYEPLKPTEPIDPLRLRVGDPVTATTYRGEKIEAAVTEVGIGKAVRREGTLTYHVFEDDMVAYAECRGKDGVYSIEKYNEREFDMYKGTLLTRDMQRRLLGRTVSPGVRGKWRMMTLKSKLSLLFWVGIISVAVVPAMIPRYQTYCTPRTIQNSQPGSTQRVFPVSTPRSPDDQVVSSNDQQTCYRRRVYGGGGGGVGK